MSHEHVHAVPLPSVTVTLCGIDAGPSWARANVTRRPGDVCCPTCWSALYGVPGALAQRRGPLSQTVSTRGGTGGGQPIP